MGKRYLTQPQLKERYGGISDMTVWRWVRLGRISPPALYGNRNYFDEDELDEADRRAKAEYRRAQAEPSKHVPPHLQNSSK
ncbi:MULTISPECIES: helix-turn-helix transcriptional regulator [Rhizobium]|jgi:predicted site-specific integrase-resolvase|uniref:helix-turn-helix transcriptional regulator n=1 Tax=Rhizobium TaxID=379 RepID=UPI0010324718|nr:MULTISPECIES: helix-turn-helix domain-containing protein [Rhizobium]NEJ06249.1 DNA-binding protein [Rhizobium ruizarguesonis]QIO58758.1 helix-turn-helix domain-containing protein [Rhizobium leguminosarum bv. trifolii]TBA14680.1 DNA-binding protein [Rhizobium ruizarguesonis]